MNYVRAIHLLDCLRWEVISGRKVARNIVECFVNRYLDTRIEYDFEGTEIYPVIIDGPYRKKVSRGNLKSSMGSAMSDSVKNNL